MADAGNNPTAGVDIGEVKQAVLDHLWMPFTQHNDLAEAGGPLVIVEGDGVRIKDSDGKSYIDGIGGLFLVNVGHGRQEIVDAVTEQLSNIHYANTFSYATIPTANLATKLAELAPGDLNKVFLASGGSEAVDTALKIARQYHVNRGEPQRTKLIARRGSYHGVSLGALSVNSWEYVQRSVWEPMLANVRFVGPTAEEVEELIEFEGPETFAAFITEPVSITKGVVVPPDDYWPKMREICDKHGILLIADEVINGFGRTGKMFAIEHWGVTPDLMTFAKGVTSGYQPVGGVMAGPKVTDAFVGEHEKTFTHGYTYSGHPAGAAAALANLEIIERENLVENAADVGNYMLDQLSALKEHSMVKEVRGIGLLAAVELVKDKATGEP
ncbi:MAG: aspartate aminotransferase family protein, partial [Dehalococcoidia bacterium]